MFYDKNFLNKEKFIFKYGSCRQGRLYYTIYNAIERALRDNKTSIILIKLICEIRELTKGKVISVQENNFHPTKNLTRQEVYESFVEIQSLVKGNYPFLSDEKFIEELLEEK